MSVSEITPEPHWHAAALTHLTQADPILAQAIAKVPGPVRPAAHEDLYLALLRAIVSQQISTKAAAAIWRRFTALFAKRACRARKPATSKPLPTTRSAACSTTST
jgi:3-methyladenine DNA glycosylase/8-oxoguanine DNA glycosylase